jgi:peptidoglycan/xylan/chitin deacetylase (PgdA/CDA1 family)
MVFKKIKSIARYLGAGAVAIFLIILGSARRVKKRAFEGEFILSIYFHYPSKQLFEFCVKWLIRNRFQFLSPDDLKSVAKGTLTFPKGAVIITVDDGWLTNKRNIFPIALKYEIPVTIFVATDPVKEGNYWETFIEFANTKKELPISVNSLKKIPDENREKILKEFQNKFKLKRNVLTIEEVQEAAMTKFVSIGSHTKTHPVLINCNDKKAFWELQESKTEMEGWLNKKIDHFAYPYGAYSEREINYLKKTGYSSAYTTKKFYLTPESLKNIYELPRFCINEDASKPEAICRMLGIKLAGTIKYFFYQNAYKNG